MRTAGRCFALLNVHSLYGSKYAPPPAALHRQQNPENDRGAIDRKQQIRGWNGPPASGARDAGPSIA
jgi:hypothetical protein